MIQKTKILMGMPINIKIVDKEASQKDIRKIFSYFRYVDKKFSTYKRGSEISEINRGDSNKVGMSKDMKNIFDLAEKTRKQTKGYFNIFYMGRYDPSGIVKGWAILNAAKFLKKMGFKNFYIDAGGDIQVSGKNERGKSWKVGIKNPFNQKEIVKALKIDGEGVATSGSYIRGNHIYNPVEDGKIDEIVSITVIGPDILEADRFATSAFAMGKQGINFIEKLRGFEGYMIDKNKMATKTSGFSKYELI